MTKYHGWFIFINLLILIANNIFIDLNDDVTILIDNFLIDAIILIDIMLLIQKTKTSVKFIKRFIIFQLCIFLYGFIVTMINDIVQFKLYYKDLLYIFYFICIIRKEQLYPKFLVLEEHQDIMPLAYMPIEIADVDVKILKVKREYETPDECSICLQKILVNEYAGILSCFHEYHYDCIHNWLNVNIANKCPVCRQSSNDLQLL